MPSSETLDMTTINDAASGFRVLSLSGPLILKTLFEFQTAVRSDNPYGLILDLAGVEYMDSAGLGAVLGAYSSYERRKKPFALANVCERVHTLFEVTHTDQFLKAYPSVEAAKAARA